MSLWYGNQAKVRIGSAVTVNSARFLPYEMASETDISANVKEISISGGESGVEALNVYGSQLKEESRPDLKTIEFTMTFEDISMAQNFFGTESAVGSTGYSRVEAETELTGDKESKAILFTITSQPYTEVTAEAVGTGGGTASETMTLDNDYVIDGSVVISVDGTEWTRVTDFSGSGAADQHYTYTHAGKTVTFGDGTNGVVCTNDKAVTGYYWYTAADSATNINILLNNAYLTTTGDLTLAADGSAEQTWSASCKLSDYYMEDNI